MVWRPQLPQRSNVEHAQGDKSCPAARQFPAQNFKENQRSILQMLQELCSRKWEEEKRETFKTRSFSNACILLMNHFYFELAHLDLLACVAVYDPCYTISF